MRANTYCQSLILHTNVGPLGTAASLHASNASLAAIPNVTLLEAPWANREPETDVCWPYPKIVDGYALPLEGPGLGIELMRNWRHPSRLCLRCRAHVCEAHAHVGPLDALLKARLQPGVGAGSLNTPDGQLVIA